MHSMYHYSMHTTSTTLASMHNIHIPLASVMFSRHALCACRWSGRLHLFPDLVLQQIDLLRLLSRVCIRLEKYWSIKYGYYYVCVPTCI